MLLYKNKSLSCTCSTFLYTRLCKCKSNMHDGNSADTLIKIFLQSRKNSVNCWTALTFNNKLRRHKPSYLLMVHYFHHFRYENIVFITCALNIVLTCLILFVYWIFPSVVFSLLGFPTIFSHSYSMTFPNFRLQQLPETLIEIVFRNTSIREESEVWKNSRFFPNQQWRWTFSRKSPLFLFN